MAAPWRVVGREHWCASRVALFSHFDLVSMERNERACQDQAYESPMPRERARQTRPAILLAAYALFLQCGYASTTVARVAAGAGVSVDTVYCVFGSMSGLLAAVMDVDVGGGDEPVAVLERELPPRMRAEQDQRTQIGSVTGGAGHRPSKAPAATALA